MNSIIEHQIDTRPKPFTIFEIRAGGLPSLKHEMPEWLGLRISAMLDEQLLQPRHRRIGRSLTALLAIFPEEIRRHITTTEMEAVKPAATERGDVVVDNRPVGVKAGRELVEAVLERKRILGGQRITVFR